MQVRSGGKCGVVKIAAKNMKLLETALPKISSSPSIYTCKINILVLSLKKQEENLWLIGLAFGSLALHLLLSYL